MTGADLGWLEMAIKVADLGGLGLFALSVWWVQREQAKALHEIVKGLAVLLERTKGGK